VRASRRSVVVDSGNNDGYLPTPSLARPSRAFDAEGLPMRPSARIAAGITAPPRERAPTEPCDPVVPEPPQRIDEFESLGFGGVRQTQGELRERRDGFRDVAPHRPLAGDRADRSRKIVEGANDERHVRLRRKAFG
jgi:hypothetical protein